MPRLQTGVTVNSGYHPVPKALTLIYEDTTLRTGYIKRYVEHDIGAAATLGGVVAQ
jgi:hypothetical protein